MIDAGADGSAAPHLPNPDHGGAAGSWAGTGPQDRSREAVAFGLVAAAIAAACPASLLGGAAALAGWSVTPTPIVTSRFIASLGFVTTAALRGQLLLGWPWRLLAHVAAPQLVGGVVAASIARSLPMSYS